MTALASVNPSPRPESATVAEIIPPHIALADELGLTGFAAVLRAEDAFPEVMDEATEKAFVKRMGEIHETTEAQTGPLALLDKMLVKWLFGPDTDTGPFTPTPWAKWLRRSSSSSHGTSRRAGGSGRSLGQPSRRAR